MCKALVTCYDVCNHSPVAALATGKEEICAAFLQEICGALLCEHVECHPMILFQVYL